MSAPSSSAPPRPVDLVEIAVEAAHQAVDLLIAGRERARATAETKSSGTDMVSELDRASEELIVSSLLAARPSDGIVGEEGSNIAGTNGVRWVIDPLDGTTNYLYDYPGWGISIAAEVDGAVMAGVVCDPVHQETFTAARGGGAHLNGEPIACSVADDLSTALVATGFGYQAERRRAQAEVLVELLPAVRDIRRMGAAAVDLCSVACGRVDAFFERGLEWWDLAAGGLIAEESGAVVSSLGGAPARAGSVVAAAPGIAAPLSALLSALGAESGP